MDSILNTVLFENHVYIYIYICMYFFDTAKRTTPLLEYIKNKKIEKQV